MTDRTIYEIDDVRVDRGRMSATRGDSVIPLEPKAFDVLLFLIENRDRLVTKDELLDAVWPGTFVTPNVLTRAVAQVRKGLGDESQDARYIETVAKRGYRFIAPVTVRQPAAPIREGAHPEPVPGPALPTRGARPRFRLPALIVVLVILALASTAAIIVVGRRSTQPLDPEDVHLTRLTNRRGFNGTPAIAPDGRSVVYASDATGTLELYLTSLLPGGAEVQLTRDGGENIQPAWSSDARWIAFHSRKRGGVWIMPAAGGVPQQITEFGSDPAWSPDGQHIVFTSDAGGLVGHSSLWIVNRDGGGRRPLTEIGKPAGGHRAPTWSHDGRLVAFVVGLGGWEQQLWSVDVGSGAQHFIATGVTPSDPCFSLDDRFVYWGGRTETGNGRLSRTAINEDGEGTGRTEVVLPLDAGIVGGLSLASDGTLVFSLMTFDSNLWTIDVATGGHPSEPIRLTDDEARNTHPDYSFDGRIAYMQVPVGTPPTAWLVRDDGTEKTALLAGTEVLHPQWTADGTRLLVVRRNGEAHEFAWVDLASRRVTPIGPLNDMLNARLSPDGRQLAFHNIDADGAISVWIAGFDGSRRQLATDREAVSYPVWSPDGESLAVELKRGDSTQIGVVDRATGRIAEVTTGRGQNWPYSWAPDNDRIAFAGERDGVWNIFTVSRSSKAVVPLTSFTSSTGYVRYPAWSPKGTRVVFERALQTGAVWTMQLPSR